MTRTRVSFKYRYIQHGLMLFCALILLGIRPGPESTKRQMSPEHLMEFRTNWSGIHLPFILNQGQLDERIQFYTKTFCSSVYVTGGGNIEYRFPARNKVAKNLTNRNNTLTQKDVSAGPLVIEEEFIRRSKVTIRGEKPAPTKVNYLKGDDSNKWQTNLQTYTCVSLGEIYEGIELKLKIHGNTVEKLFYLKPGAHPEDIKVKLSGTRALHLNEAEELDARSEHGTLKFTKPVAYQRDESGNTNKMIKVAYTLNGDEYGFKIGEYDFEEMLVIDPLLASSFIGGSGEEVSYAIALDQEDNVYVAGETKPPGSSSASACGDLTISSVSNDWFLAPVNRYNLALHGLPVEEERIANNDKQTTGMIQFVSLENDFPITSGAFDSTPNGETDIFVSKFDANLTTLAASTFLGGRRSDFTAGNFRTILLPSIHQ